MSSTASAPAHRITARGRLALRMAAAATWASRRTGRGGGSMIGGLIALKIAPDLMAQLAAGRSTVLITGTNGKSTTNRMLAAALRSLGPLATNADGANMDAGLVAALAADPAAPRAALEVDELHVPHVADAVRPRAAVLLNLSSDQADRVGSVASIEARLREGLARHPDCVPVANCDDVLITSIAYDDPATVWVSVGRPGSVDIESCPRCGGVLDRGTEEAPLEWRCTSCDLARPTPTWWLDGADLHAPDGAVRTLNLALPGAVNLGNAAQAIAAAALFGVDLETAARAAESISEVSGRYRTIQRGPHRVRTLLAKNPAGWRESLDMADHQAAVVITVNGRMGDGFDLSWLWDVPFEQLTGRTVIVTGERAADLAVRLDYADVAYREAPGGPAAIDACPPGPVEVLANYTALADLTRALDAEAAPGRKGNR